MSTLRTTNVIHGSSAISNIVLDNQGRAIFGPDSPQGRAALYVNAQTNRVGVNNESPAVALDVDGAINATGNVVFGGALTLSSNLTIGTNPSLFVDTSNTTGRVGIGTNTPTNLLEVVNSVNTSNTYIKVHNTGAGNAGVKMQNSNGEWTVIANDRLRIVDSEANVERVSILSNNRVGIGTSIPNAVLEVFGGAGGASNNLLQLRAGSTDVGTSTVLRFVNSTSATAITTVSELEWVRTDSPSVGGGSLLFKIADGTALNEAMRIVPNLVNNNVLIGAQDSPQMGKSSLAQSLQVSSNNNSAGIGMRRASDTGFGPYAAFAKARGTLSSPLIVQDGDEIGHMSWGAYDGTDYRSYCAHISAEIQGTPSSNDTPGKLVFATTSPGSSSSTTRMSIESTGAIVLPNSSPGITFGTSGGSGRTSKNLADYEQGTWDPVVAFGGNSTGLTYGGRTGTYTKIGNVVFVQIAVNVNNIGSSSGNMVISLPYPPANSATWTQWESIGNYYLLSGAAAWNGVFPTFSDTQNGVIFAKANLTTSLMTASDVASPFNLRVTGTYIV